MGTIGREEIVGCLEKHDVHPVVVTADNLADLRQQHTHPYVGKCLPGDVVWTIRVPHGEPWIAGVWLRRDGGPPATGWLGRNIAPPLISGTLIVDGDLLLLGWLDGAGSLRKFDLRTGKELT